MKRGDLVVAEVVAMSPQGEGLAQVEGRTLIVPRAVPGDRVEARVRGKQKGRLLAMPEQFIERAVNRQEAPCQHFGRCGGCRWQDLPYADQLRFKEGLVAGALAERDVRVGAYLPALPSPSPFFYRNKMEFSFSTSPEGSLMLGLHVRGRFDRVFDVEECHLQSALSNRVVGAVRRHAAALGLPAYDLKTHQGQLRFLVVRQAVQTGETLVDLVVAQYPNPEVDALIAAVLAEVPEITTFVLTLHGGKAQVATGQAQWVVKGRGWIEEVCGGLRFVISPRSFFQTNPLQAENLYAEACRLGGDLEGMAVLDLYCGTGSLSLHLARSARSVLGVEVVAESVEDARNNAQCNGLANCEFVAGTAEEVLPALQREGKRFDRVFVDPPRAGLHPKVLAALGALRAPQVVYISCNPLTLADDLGGLETLGYQVATVQPVDMFPQTPHCEVLAGLVLAEPAAG
ncbi:MAG: 23S rRNA (uracil(1939)-C(5))-methyltransferase RlmD [Candidatus Latescibacteria bacterium]|nr:23S rRNA (uracil(1939)-C(5))-methyltransferase RlmD [Candidatus Latescibacterota bacterium]